MLHVPLSLSQLHLTMIQVDPKNMQQNSAILAMVLCHRLLVNNNQMCTPA